jgi:parvulin-like peptidyl-prolyl isomerase
MKRPGSPAVRVSLPALPATFFAAALAALLAVAASAAAPAPARAAADAPPAKAKLTSRPATGSKPAQPGALTPDNFHSPKLRGWINDVPDTGQFLADSVWILRVGPRVSTVGDFLHQWFASYPEYRPSQDSSGRVTFLNSLMNKDIMALTALGLNRPLDFEDRLAVREARQRALTTAVHVRFVDDSVKVAEPEVRALWESYNWQQHLRHILVEDRNAADLVRRELISGRITWSAAVKKFSVARTDLGADGDLGWLTPDKLDPNLAVRIYALKPGETSQPVQTTEGWHIVQSIERKPVHAPAYEAMSFSLRTQIRDVRSDVVSERLMARLRLQNGVAYDTATAKFAALQFKETMNMEQGAGGTTLNINGAAPEFAMADTARLIARWQNGGRFSIGDLIHAYTDIPPLMRPSLQRWEVLLAFTESIILEPAIADYGVQMGLEKDPLVTVPVQSKTEELLVDHMYQDSVGTRVWVSKDERKAYYQKNLAGFFTYPSVEFAAIVRESKAGADSVQRALKSGVKAAALLRADSLAGRNSGSIQSRQQNENGPYQKALFEEMRPGDIQVRGPDKQGDYAILQLISFSAGRQLSFEESEQMIDESLQNQKSDEALKAMIARLKPRYPVVWRPELVMLIKLVDPTL